MVCKRNGSKGMKLRRSVRDKIGRAPGPKRFRHGVRANSIFIYVFCNFIFLLILVLCHCL